MSSDEPKEPKTAAIVKILEEPDTGSLVAQFLEETELTPGDEMVKREDHEEAVEERVRQARKESKQSVEENQSEYFEEGFDRGRKRERQEILDKIKNRLDSVKEKRAEKQPSESDSIDTELRGMQVAYRNLLEAFSRAENEEDSADSTAGEEVTQQE